MTSPKNSEKKPHFENMAAGFNICIFFVMIESIISWRENFSCSILVGSKTMPLNRIIKKVFKCNTG